MTREADIDALFLLVRAGLDPVRYAEFLEAVPKKAGNLSTAKKEEFRARGKAMREALDSITNWRDTFNSARMDFLLGRYDGAIKRLESLDAVLPNSHELSTNLGLAYLGRYYEHRLDKLILNEIRKVQRACGALLSFPSEGSPDAQGTCQGQGWPSRRYSRFEVAAAMARGFSLAPDLLGSAGTMSSSDPPPELRKAESLLTTAARLAPDEPRVLINLVTVRSELALWNSQYVSSARSEADHLRESLLGWPDHPADQDLAWLTLATFEYLVPPAVPGQTSQKDRALNALDHVTKDGPVAALANYNRGLLLAFAPDSTEAELQKGVRALAQAARATSVGPILARLATRLEARAKGESAPLPSTAGSITWYLRTENGDGDEVVNISAGGAEEQPENAFRSSLDQALQYLTEYASGEEVVMHVTDGRGAFLVMDRQSLLRWSEGQILNLKPPASPERNFQDLPPLPTRKPGKAWPIEIHFAGFPSSSDPLSPVLPGEGDRILLYVTEGEPQ